MVSPVVKHPDDKCDWMKDVEWSHFVLSVGFISNVIMISSGGKGLESAALTLESESTQ